MLKFQPYTDETFGLGEKLDSIQKWNDFEANMKALQWLKSMGNSQIRQHILAELDTTNDLLLFIASPVFQSFRHLCDRFTILYALGYVNVPNFWEQMEFGEFLCESDYASKRKFKENVFSSLDNP